MFPRAHIIHCRRDAMDNCLSMYMQDFNVNHGYNRDLSTLGHYYKAYEDLMAHWREVLPLAILNQFVLPTGVEGMQFKGDGDFVGTGNDADNTLRVAFGNEGSPQVLEDFARRFGVEVIDVRIRRADLPELPNVRHYLMAGTKR